jgi:endonuclease/exonuclease/phosphatase family metal-dependent hydrolase
LFDIYQPELIFSDERRLRLIEELRVLDADIIGLQEVTPKCLRELLAVPWIRAHYYASEVASEEDAESPTIYPYGQLLLSKYPFKPIFHEYVLQLIPAID